LFAGKKDSQACVDAKHQYIHLDTMIFLGPPEGDLRFAANALVLVLFTDESTHARKERERKRK